MWINFLRRISFIIEASDQGLERKKATTTVTLNIEDLNDNNPELNFQSFVTEDEFDPSIG